MSIHVIDFNAPNGDIVDREYLCSADCQYLTMIGLANSDTAWRGLIPEYHAGTQRAGNGDSIEYGAWPCGEETDYDVWCANCGDFLWHGLNCDCDDRSVERDPVEPERLRQ